MDANKNIRRLTKVNIATKRQQELKDIEKDPPGYCTIEPAMDGNVYHWEAEIFGPILFEQFIAGYSLHRWSFQARY